jgi:YD repeat-containing protein
VPDSSALGSPLVVPAVQTLDEDEQIQSSAEARHNSPEAVQAREESRTKYDGESGQQAEQTDGTTFPSLVNEVAGGPPRLSTGQAVVGYDASNVAQVSLGGGEFGLVDSTVPMAIESSGKSWSPVNLSLLGNASGFEPASPVVNVHIPSRLAAGVQISSSALSVTPVGAGGTELGGSEGVIDGATVLYANTQTDTDTVIKPTTRGVDADAILRSAESPDELYYRLGLPSGARVIQTGGDGAEILDEGAVIATVEPPSAVDAAGTSVPVRISVSGNTIAVFVGDREGSYEYPISVDPEYVAVGEGITKTNWTFNPGAGYREWPTEGNGTLGMIHEGPFPVGDLAWWGFQTNGYTKIYYAWVHDNLAPWYEGGTVSYLRGWIGIEYGGVENEELTLSGDPPLTEAYECARYDCSREGVAANNGFFFETTTDETSKALEGGDEFEKEEVDFSGQLSEAAIYIAQEAGLHSTVSYNTGSSELDGTQNVMHSSTWFGPHNGAFEFKSADGGLGVAETKVELLKSGAWETLAEKDYIGTAGCKGWECAATQSETQTYDSLAGIFLPKEIPNGEDRFRVAAHSGMPDSWSSEHGEGEATIKVDKTPPHSLKLAGLPEHEGTYELGEVEAHIRGEATDGEGTTPSSGVKSLALYINEHEIGSPGGSCNLGPCTASHEWAINGAELGSGSDTLTLKATDNAGNVETKSFSLTVYHASPVAIGPGSVNPESGDFALEATDVDLSGSTEALTVTRHYDSRNITAGAEGPLGPQWTIGLGSLTKLEVLPDKSVIVTGAAGSTHFPTKEGGGFASPVGDSNLTLEYEPSTPAYLLKDTKQGTTTEFTLPEGAQQWLPTISKGPLSSSVLTDEYKTVEGPEGKKIVEPTLELAPHPEATCSRAALEKLEIAAKGCRALEFVYQETEGTAKGEARIEWGSYKHRLKEVFAIAYNPVTKAMARIAVAAYEWDGRGRLRAEWNPQISPAVKTTYGYDGAEDVTAVAAPGQQPWIMTYGTAAGDTSTGRLLKVMRPAATTTLWAGELPKNTEAPKLSGSAVVGVTMGVSTGVWSHSAVAYGYQWEECAPGTESCTPIVGATNPDYAPTSGEVGHALVAVVTASNAGGSVTATTSRSAEVVTGTGTEGTHYTAQPGSTIDYGVPLTGGPGLNVMTPTEVAKWGQTDDPEVATAIFPPSKPTGWPATEYAGATVYYMDRQARTVNVTNPAGGISTEEFNEDNEVTRSLSAENRARAVTEPKPAEAAELLSTQSNYAEGQLEQTWGPRHEVKLVIGKSGESEEVLARNHIRYFYDEGAKEAEEKNHESYDLVTKTTDGAETASKEEFDVRTATTSYSGQKLLGWKLRKPTSETTEPSGIDLTTVTKYEETTGNVIETQSPAAAGKDTNVPLAYLSQFGTKGTGADQLETPTGDALDAHANVWVADSGNNRLDEFSSSGSFIEGVGFGVVNGETKLQTCTTSCKAGIAGAAKGGQLSDPVGLAIANGDIFVADYGNSRIDVFTEKAEFVTSFGAKGTGAGQFTEGPNAIAVASTGNVWATDRGDNRLEEFSSSGSFIEGVGFGVTNGENKFETCTISCQAGTSGSGNGQLASPDGITVTGTDLAVTESANGRVQEFNAAGEYAGKFGKGHFSSPVGIATNAAGQFYVSDSGADRVEKWSAGGVYLSTFGSKGTGNGEMSSPSGVAVSTVGDVYVVDSENDRVQEWAPAVAGNEGAHTVKSVYYSAAKNKSYAACGEHPEWAGLPCKTLPEAQPGVSGTPNLPEVKIAAYDIWNQAETVTETFGSTVRTKTTSFDSAGRPQSTEETSSVDAPLPKVTDKFSEKSGTLETQSTTAGETTKTITRRENSLGELESYTDADGNTAKFTYNVNEHVTEVTDSSEEGHGKQTYKYNEITGELTGLTDSGAGTFGATYGPGGTMTSETFPGGLSAYLTHNSVGAETAIEYKKKGSVWFSDAIVPSIHGETLKQVSTLSEENYTNNAAGDITQVQETPIGEGCKTRLYTYDEEQNRTTETSRNPASEGKCATEGGSTEWHTYDTGNHLSDAGVAFEALGNITKLPAADAGGTELTSGYYVDGQVEHQSQEGEELEYKLDPEDRTRETISSGKTASKVIDHYDAPGSTVAWTSEPATGAWTRNIPGIGGELVAVETNTSAPVLQLHDLQGNVVATAGIAESETKLLSTYNSTEFGVPSGKGAPPPFAWLGADELSSALSSGAITQDGSTYVPQTGRQLQSEPVDVPIPTNSINVFITSQSAWMAQVADEMSANQVAKGEEEARAREEADKPVGLTPAPSCNEEADECEEGDPEFGENTHDCKVWASWGGLSAGFSNDIGIYAHFKCADASAGFEIKIELQLVLYGGVENGEYELVGTDTHDFRPSETKGEHETSKVWECTPGKWYRAVVFGRYWYTSGYSPWHAYAVDGRELECSAELAPAEYPTQ